MKNLIVRIISGCMELLVGVINAPSQIRPPLSGSIEGVWLARLRYEEALHNSRSTGGMWR